MRNATRLLWIAASILLADGTFAVDPFVLTNWTKVSDQSTPYYRGGAISPDGTVVVVADTFTTASTNGVDWTSITSFPLGGPPKCYYFNGQFMACGGYDGGDPEPPAPLSLAWFGWSTNGFDWTFQLEPNQAGDVKSIAFSGRSYLACAGGDYFYRSIDGRSWQRDAEQSPLGLVSLTYGTGYFVGITYSFGVLISTDGTSWRGVYTPFAGASGSQIVFGNGVFVATAHMPGTVICSNDGISWSRVSEIPQYGYQSGAGLRSITFSSGRFYATTYDCRFAHSFDGYHWTVVGAPAPPTSPAPVILTAGNGHAYAGGPGILRSPEFTTLVPTISGLQIFGTAGSRHILEYLDDQQTWKSSQEVQLGPTGSAVITDWRNQTGARMFQLISAQ